jgi:hypothetical protein
MNLQLMHKLDVKVVFFYYRHVAICVQYHAFCGEVIVNNGLSFVVTGREVQARYSLLASSWRG